jgi:hypothetical protein
VPKFGFPSPFFGAKITPNGCAENAMRGNFLRAEANSYWSLGEIETAEAKLESLIKINPDWAWGVH